MSQAAPIGGRKALGLNLQDTIDEDSKLSAAIIPRKATNILFHQTHSNFSQIKHLLILSVFRLNWMPSASSAENIVVCSHCSLSASVCQGDLSWWFTAKQLNGAINIFAQRRGSLKLVLAEPHDSLPLLFCSLQLFFALRFSALLSGAFDPSASKSLIAWKEELPWKVPKCDRCLRLPKTWAFSGRRPKRPNPTRT